MVAATVMLPVTNSRSTAATAAAHRTARLRSKIALGVGVAMVHEALGASDTRDGVDGRSHAIRSVIASTSAVLFRSVRILCKY